MFAISLNKSKHHRWPWAGGVLTRSFPILRTEARAAHQFAHVIEVGGVLGLGVAAQMVAEGLPLGDKVLWFISPTGKFKGKQM